MNRSHLNFFSIIALYILITTGCKETEVPENPYNSIAQPDPSSSAEPDPHSIEGLHKNIFSVRCAMPGCHDGTFEPDFRTVQSTWSSLVYQPVIKTTVDSLSFFTLRVEPFSATTSFLFERITTTTSDYMPSNGSRLVQNDINAIAAWINNGAKDISGNIPVKPNIQPNIEGYFAFDLAFQQVDTNRVGDFIANPFIVSTASFYITYNATDSLDGADSTAVGDFTGCKIKFSANKDDFSTAITVPSLYGGVTLPFWYSQIPAGLWPVGTIVYFRIYVNDGDHIADSEFPRNGVPDYFKTYYSFYVQ